jgi:hypothetical protein
MPARTPYECARLLAEFLVDNGITRFSGRALTTLLLEYCGTPCIACRSVLLDYLEYELGRMGLNLVRCRFNGEYNVYYITPIGDGVDCMALVIYDGGRGQTPLVGKPSHRGEPQVGDCD